MCPHLCIYSLKSVLRCESPRDYADLLLAMKIPPTFVFADFAHQLAVHTNLRHEDFFRPHTGRIADDTEEKIQHAENGTLSINMDCVSEDFCREEESFATLLSDYSQTRKHPITFSDNVFCLVDIFHEKNSAKHQEIFAYGS